MCELRNDSVASLPQLSACRWHSRREPALTRCVRSAGLPARHAAADGRAGPGSGAVRRVRCPQRGAQAPRRRRHAAARTLQCSLLPCAARSCLLSWGLQSADRALTCAAPAAHRGHLSWQTELIVASGDWLSKCMPEAPHWSGRVYAQAPTTCPAQRRARGTRAATERAPAQRPARLALPRKRALGRRHRPLRRRPRCRASSWEPRTHTPRSQRREWPPECSVLRPAHTVRLGCGRPDRPSA